MDSPAAAAPANHGRHRHTGQQRGASSERDTHRQHHNLRFSALVSPTPSANTRGNARHSRPTWPWLVYTLDTNSRWSLYTARVDGSDTLAPPMADPFTRRACAQFG
ncbi:MAG: hypothetical protein IPO15_14135 [Anaerolineae bacterium]|uniref:hypothetical protein n=1 Tax=Candidatus Amarolinea dominans TaxID=3140696 RepID=UPI0031356296|nr:hypothetical protein [Anaerolineae bacterium]